MLLHPFLQQLFLLPVLGVSIVVGLSPFKRADGLKVTSPNAGDKFTTGINIDIKWETSSAENVKLELRKGPPETLVTVHIISSETPNNGSYQWRSDEDDFLRSLVSDSLPRAPPSDCDYAVAVEDSDTTANSGYITIINTNDDGLPDDAVCPEVKGSARVEDTGSGSGDGDGAGSGDEEEPDSNGNNTGSSDGNENSTASSNNSGSVTKAMLGGVVGGVAAALILIFLAILLVGRPRGWFVTKEYIDNEVSASVAAAMENAPLKDMYNARAPLPELNSETIHQMPSGPAEK